MKPVFNIALNINNQEIQISLQQDGHSSSKIMLGGIEYSIDYSGPIDFQAALVHKLTERFKIAPVTTKSLQTCLNDFGIVAVTELSEKLNRGLKRAQLIGKGMHAIHERSLNNIADEARGRMIMDSYYIETLANQDGDVFAAQKRQLFMLWKADNTTKLSLPEWELYKIKQWENTKDGTEFLPWLHSSAWVNSGTKDSFYTSILRHDHKEFHIPIPFDAWKKEMIAFISKDLGEYLDKTATEEQILQLFLEPMISGLNISGHDYIEFKLWQKAKSTEPFSDWMLRKEWDKSPTSVSFDEFKSNKQLELTERWHQSGMQEAGIDFDTWRRSQDPTLLNDTGLKAFVHCTDETRKQYKLSSTADGLIYRNDTPYTTDYETTLHSGDGYAIFVVGPDEEIYAASHIPQVFHHSSFFADGAILAGGELRTGLDFVVEHAKDEKHKKSLLKNFEITNKDPYKMQLVKNDKNNTWTIAGEVALGKIKVLDIPLDSSLHQTLQTIDLNSLSFTQRANIIEQSATLLGRSNPKNQITLLSSKSGHYRPDDEENYYMLKRWEKNGVDLTKTAFASLGSSSLYRSAKEYIDQIEPILLARQQKRVFIESGYIQDNQHKFLLATEKTIVINKQGDCYLRDDFHEEFKHNDMIKAKNLPGFQDNDIVLKKTIQSEIEKLKIKKVSINEHITELDKLIKQTTKSARANRSGRLITKEAELSRVDKIDRAIDRLEKSMEPSVQCGKQDILGGGIISINAEGKIKQINTKLGDYILSENEIKNTLFSLKKQGVKLETVALTVYDKLGHPTAPQNANQYLIDKHTATLKIKSTIIPASIEVLTEVGPEANALDVARETTQRFKTEIKQDSPTIEEEKGDLTRIARS